MKKYILIVLLLTSSFYQAEAIGRFNPSQPQKQCYNLYWKIDDTGIQAGENIGVIVDKNDIIAVQGDSYLPLHPSDTKEDYIGYDITGLLGDTKLLKDDDFTTSLSLNPMYGNEIIIRFHKVLDSETAKFIYVDTSSFYDKNFYYSLDGKVFTKFNHFDLNKYKIKYLKIVYTPKPEKKQSESEIISIPEISIKDTKQLFIIEPQTSNPIEIFGENTCSYGLDTSSFIDTNLELKDTSIIYDINLTTKDEFAVMNPNQELEKKTVAPIDDKENLLQNQNTNNFPIFPPIDKLVYAMIAFAFILVISLYIRENAKLKSEKGILPQNSVFGVKTKKDVKKLFQTIKKSTEELRSVKHIESIEVTIGKSKKKKIFKSDKLIKLLGVMTAHYEKNKNDFLPGELRQIYTSIIDNFKNNLDSEEHKKALGFIDEFIEKGGKLVINKKKNTK